MLEQVIQGKKIFKITILALYDFLRCLLVCGTNRDHFCLAHQLMLRT